jgi:hypothetical protein
MVQQFINTHRSQHERAPIDAQGAQRAAQLQAARRAAHQQRLAAAENELAQRRATILATLKPQLDAMRLQQPTAGVSTRALAPMVLRGPIVPHVTSISAAEGVPGDGIMIKGTGFGTTPGQVHFVVGPQPSQDLVATGLNWTDGQIFAPVPDPSVPDPSVGAVQYQGILYIVTTAGQSNQVSFKFDPIIDHRWITVPADYLLSTSGSENWIDKTWVMHDDMDDFSSKSGVDTFFRHTFLQNGWTVEGQPAVNVVLQDGPGSLVPVIAMIGSNSPVLNVFWSTGWSPAWFSEIWYSIEIPIWGPRGLPDGVVCVSKPAPGQACPNSQ